MSPAITRAHEAPSAENRVGLAAERKLRVAIDFFPRTQPCLHELNQAACNVQLNFKPDLHSLDRPGIPWGELDLTAALTRLTDKAREEFKREAIGRRVPGDIAEQAARHVRVKPIES